MPNEPNLQQLPTIKEGLVTEKEEQKAQTKQPAPTPVPPEEQEQMQTPGEIKPLTAPTSITIPGQAMRNAKQVLMGKKGRGQVAING